MTLSVGIVSPGVVTIVCCKLASENGVPNHDLTVAVGCGYGALSCFASTP